MNKTLQKLGIAAIIAVLVAPLFFTGPKAATGASLSLETPIALFETTLASGITADATSMTLTSALTLDGTQLASSTYSFILDEGTASQEFVRADCTATACTNMDRGISAITGTSTVASLKKTHRRGASVKITDGPVLINIARILNGQGTLPSPIVYSSDFTIASSSRQLIAAYQALGMAETASTSARLTLLSGNNTWTGTNLFSGVPTFSSSALPIFNSIPTLTDDKQLTYKKYVDDLATTASSSAKATLLSGNNTWTGTNLFSGVPTFSSSAIPIFDSDPTLTDDKHVATKKYVDDASFAGGVNGSELVKGVYQLATKAQAALGTILGSTGANLVLPASMATSTSDVATTSVVITGTDGKIDSSFLLGKIYSFLGLTTTNATTTSLDVSGTATIGTLIVENCTGCGSGGSTIATSATDGDVDVSTEITLERDMYYDSLVVSSGGTINTGGYRIYAQTSVNVQNGGTIQNNGGDGSDGVAPSGSCTGYPGGTAGTQAPGVTVIPGIAGKIGGASSCGGGSAGIAGFSTTFNLSDWNGVAGGNGASASSGGGTGGAAGATSSSPVIGIVNSFIAYNLFYTSTSTYATSTYSTTAQARQTYNLTAGAGSGASGSYTTSCAASGGVGGGSGASGGMIWISTPELIVDAGGTIQAIGGDGGSGSSGGGGCSPLAGVGGGGGGGNGGVLLFLTPSYTNNGTVSTAGGIGGGIGATGTKTGATSGNEGVAGRIIILQ